VFGLSLYTTERELEKEFGRFGTISKITVVLDGKTGRSRGFAFVTYEKVEDASAARDAMADTEMDGKKIRVDYSITKRVVAHVILVSALGPNPSFFLFRGTFIQLGGLLGQGPGLGLGPGLDNYNRELVHYMAIKNWHRTTTTEYLKTVHVSSGGWYTKYKYI